MPHCGLYCTSPIYFEHQILNFMYCRQANLNGGGSGFPDTTSEALRTYVKHPNVSRRQAAEDQVCMCGTRGRGFATMKELPTCFIPPSPGLTLRDELCG